MTASDVISTGALLAMGVIALVLVMQCRSLYGIGKMIRDCKNAARWERISEMENRELRSALRAEKAHVEQLQRKLMLLEAMIPVT